MRRDGGLRPIFRERLHSWQWTSIETTTVPGVPDSEYGAPGGATGWVEFKATTGWAIVFQPFQVAWIDRRARYGGRVFIAVRRRPTARKHQGVDQLWIVPGFQAITLELSGLKAMGQETFMTEGGPAAWDWATVSRVLTG
jgi:hypothetical protein